MSGEAGFFIMIVLLCIAFNGDPDLIDAIIYSLMAG